MAPLLRGLALWAWCLCMTAQAATPAAQPADLFDFWVGDWDLSWTGADGSAGRGRNRITKTLDGTVIEENFEETPDGKTPPLRGHSLSVLHKGSGTWRQAWVDNQGGFFSFSAQVDGDKRIFITDVTHADGKASAQRMVFHAIASNSLMWDWERTVDGGKTWTLLWRIAYRRHAEPQAGAWQAAPAMRHARAAHAVVAANGAVYALAGTGSAGPVREVERFDGRAWAQESSLPGEGLNAPAAAALGPRIYLIGGFGTTTNVPVAQVWVYDTATHRWSEAAPLPRPRGGHAAVVLSGRIHVIGGGNSVSTIADHSVYDPATDRWSELAPLPRAMGSPAAVVHDGVLVSIGGRSGPKDFGEVWRSLAGHAADPAARHRGRGVDLRCDPSVRRRVASAARGAGRRAALRSIA